MKKTTILCPATLTLGLISSKWKAHLLSHISNHSDGLRFGELSRLLPGISRNVLSQSLSELEADGFLIRTEFPEIPPKVIYTLTDIGQDIQQVIQLLADFGLRYMVEEKSKVSMIFGNEKVEQVILEGIESGKL